MSTVFFNSPSETSELRGSERMYAANITTSVGLSILLPSPILADEGDWKRLRDALRPNLTHVTSAVYLEMALRTECGELQFVLPDGSSHNVLDVILNTCIDLGNEGLCLLAKMHAQCEIHGFIEGADRAWFADVIDRGLNQQHILREDVGWDKVMAHARRRSDEPMVMSCSMTSEFPNKRVAGVSDDGDDFQEKRPAKEQWDLCMTELRRRRLQIGPATLTQLGFGSCLNAIQVRRALQRRL